jgi:hypothetical protein
MQLGACYLALARVHHRGHFGRGFFLGKSRQDASGFGTFMCSELIRQNESSYIQGSFCNVRTGTCQRENDEHPLQFPLQSVRSIESGPHL